MSRKGLMISVLNLCIFLMLCVMMSCACAEKSFAFQGKNYTLPEDSDFNYYHALASNSFFYGAKSLGTLRFKGELYKSDKDYNYRPAFGARGSLRLEYSYNGQFQKTKEERWHIESDGLRKIRGYDLGFLNNIATGCIMIEKSQDGIKWEKAIDPIKNYFDKEKTGKECILLQIPEGTSSGSLLLHPYQCRTRHTSCAQKTVQCNGKYQL